MADFGLSLWLHRMEDIVDDVAEIPPAHIIMYPDLLEKAWGWQRLFPYKCYMDWSVYKRYLKEYHEKNRDEAAALILDNKPDCCIQGIASYHFFRSSASYDFRILRAAADMCARREKKLLQSRCARRLTDEDLQLSREISKYAKHVMESESEDTTTFSSAAAPGFMCLMKEAKLMLELLHRQFDFDTAELVSLSSKIRRSAWNLMQLPVPVDEDESTIIPAAAAMVGVANEAKMMRYLLTQTGS